MLEITISRIDRMVLTKSNLFNDNDIIDFSLLLTYGKVNKIEEQEYKKVSLAEFSPKEEYTTLVEKIANYDEIRIWYSSYDCEDFNTYYYLVNYLSDKNNYDENIEKQLLNIIKQKEEYDKKLLSIEILMGIISILPLLISTIIVLLFPLEEWLASVIVGTSLIPLLIATPFALRIEQTAGYYECQKCYNRYIPAYKNVFEAMHIGRTRYMKCPKCNKSSWNKKVITK